MKTRIIKLIKTFLCIFALTSTFPTKTLLATELTLELVDVPSLALENEKTAQPTVFIGTPFQLKVTVKNGGKGSLHISGIEGVNKLNVLGQSQMSNTYILNGAVTVEQNHILNVVAQQEGSLTIGPASQDQNGNIIKSNTIQVRAVKRPEDSSKIKTASGAKFEGNTEDKDVVCELLADKKSPFLGEPFIITLKVIANDQVAQLGLEQINFPGFSYKEIDKQQQHREIINNKVTEIIEQKFALTTLQPGLKTINPLTVVYQARSKNKRNAMSPFGDAFFSGFFDQVRLEEKRTQSNSLKINVKPLPTTTESVDGIGIFKSFEMITDKTSALANEAITLTLSLEGTGNFDQISTPKLQFPDFIKNYESKNNFTPNPSLGTFGGKKTFEYVIQVSKPGSITIPAQKFTYFDTDSKAYKTINTNDITLSIAQPAGEQVQPRPQAQAQTSQEQETTTGQISRDIGFIEEATDFNKSNNWTNNWNIPLWLLLILLVISVLFMFDIHTRLISIFTKSSTLKTFNKRSALSKFQKEFEMLQKNNAAEKIYGLLLCLLAARFDTTTQSITSDFIEQNLLQSGWDEKRINDFVDYLNECAELHFITATKKLAPNQINALFKNGQRWVMLLTNQSIK